MEIRNAEKTDIERIEEIYNIGRAFMRSLGNTVQWVNGYPDRELVENDILSKRLFVITEENTVYGVFYFHIGEDETYNYIEGEWLNNEDYGVIHRIASSGEKKGILKAASDFAFAKIRNVRIDTHEKNLVMQKALEKLGYKKCGVIYISDGTPRVAYQKNGK